MLPGDSSSIEILQSNGRENHFDTAKQKSSFVPLTSIVAGLTSAVLSSSPCPCYVLPPELSASLLLPPSPPFSMGIGLEL